MKIRGCRISSSRARTGSSSRASVATPSRSRSLIRGLNGSDRGWCGEGTCTRTVESAASAWACTSAAMLAEVPPG